MESIGLGQTDRQRHSSIKIKITPLNGIGTFFRVLSAPFISRSIKALTIPLVGRTLVWNSSLSYQDFS